MQPGGAVYFGTRPSHFGKFYTIHLSDPGIDQEAKDAIGRRSGLRLTFIDGRVFWSRWQEAGDQ